MTPEEYRDQLLGKYASPASKEQDYKMWLADLKERMPAGIWLECVIIKGGIQRGAWKKPSWLTRTLVGLAWWVLRKDSFVIIKY